jgi:hypothetical protein
MLGADGSFYGTTSSGGSGGGGNIFQIVGIAPVFLSVAQTAGAVTFTWTSVVGQNYQVQYTVSLIQPIWNNLGGVITATNATTTAIDSTSQDSQRFYRVVLQ